MTAVEFVAALRRQWYVLVFALVCSGIGMFAIHHRTIGYKGCEGLYLSAPPAALNVYEGNNPYLDQSPSLAMTTGVVVQTMMSQAVQDSLRTTTGSTDYSVSQTNTGMIRFPSYAWPTLQICSASTSPEVLRLTVGKVTSKFASVLFKMQAAQHAKPNALIQTKVLSPLLIYPVLGRPSQAYLGVLLIGLISGLALAVWTDLVRRKTAVPGRFSRQEGHAAR